MNPPVDRLAIAVTEAARGGRAMPLAPAAWNVVPPPIARLVSHDHAAWPDHQSMEISR